MSIFPDGRTELNLKSYVKDFIIERIKKGESPSKIKANVKKQFESSVSLMAITRVRKEYINLTGEYLKSYQEFHGLAPYGKTNKET